MSLEITSNHIKKQQKNMEFTGERFLTNVSGDIVLEHLHRYLLACELVKDKIVLDIACGSGYGSAMLSTVAKAVTGVDIAEEAINYAKTEYQASNLQFIQGQIADIPLATAAVDVVVSFETIEHLTEHEAMFQEIRRVLKPGGLLIISSPDKYEYTDVPGIANEYHVKELYKQEFVDLLNKNFAHSQVTGQRVIYASVVGSENTTAPFLAWEQTPIPTEPSLETRTATAETKTAAAETKTAAAEPRTIGLEPSLETGTETRTNPPQTKVPQVPVRQFNPLYFLALASDSPLPELACGILQAPVDQSNLACTLQKKLQQLQTAQTQADSWKQQLHQAQTELQQLYASRSWRLTAPLRQALAWLKSMAKAIDKLISPVLTLVLLLPAALVFYRGFKLSLMQLAQGKLFFSRVLVHRNFILNHLHSHPTKYNQLVGILLNYAWKIYTFGLLNLHSEAKNLQPCPCLLGTMRVLACQPNQKSLLLWQKLLKLIPKSEPSPNPAKATVIVPVYNGLEHVQNLCACLFQNSPPETQYIFINDASPDPNIALYLAETLANQPQCQLLTNTQNLGFVKTVNAAVKLVKTPYFVLLNTDVVLPAHWLERLLAPLQQDKSIASSTPFSNSAVFFSYPKHLQDNKLLDGYNLDQIDAAFQHLEASPTLLNTVHSGVGFCLGVNTKIWQQLGGFDEIFAKGYGEENDWCMRANSQGFSQVLVPNLFVYHAHGGSFSSEAKAKLAAEHMQILEQRWPDALAQASNQASADPWKNYRALASLFLNNPKTLYIEGQSHPGLFTTPKLTSPEQAEPQLLGQTDLLLTPDPSNPQFWQLLNCQDPDNPIAIPQLSELKNLWHIPLFQPITEICLHNFENCSESMQAELLQFCLDLKQQYQISLTYLNPTFLQSSFAPWPEFLSKSQNKLPQAFVPSNVEACLVIDFYFKSGGAYAYGQREIESLQTKYPVYLLQYTHIDYNWFLTDCKTQTSISLQQLSNLELIIKHLNIKQIHINNLVNCKQVEEVLTRLRQLKAVYHLKLHYVFHDFFSLCPSCLLLLKDLKFCGGGSSSQCATCAPHNQNFCLPRSSLVVWRQNWDIFFNHVDELICFSQSSADLIHKIYPRLKLNIKEHQLLEEFSSSYQAPPASAPLIVGFLGDFCEVKGSKHVIELAKLMHEQDAKSQVIVFGTHPAETYDHIEYHGPYLHQNLPQLLTKSGVKAIVLSSICSETFSFIALECMSMQIPLVCFDIGAPAERIRKYSYALGGIAPEFSAKSLLQTLETLLTETKA